MGFSRIDLELLIRLAEQRYIPLNRYIVEIGAQQLSNDFLRASDLVSKAGAVLGGAPSYSLPTELPSQISSEGVELLGREAPFARHFWRAHGFEYTAIDVDGSPESVPLDLNFDEVPRTLRGRFGLVTNFGTTEHICNQLNAFKSIHDLAALGGVMVHHLPAAGALNHGIFNYNMKFFWHLARSNDYKWLYANYYGSQHSYAFPQNIREFVDAYEPASMAKVRQREVSDCAIQIAFQKQLDIAFVPPIDVDTGLKTTNTELNYRYWTVFQPELLEATRRGKSPRTRWRSEIVFNRRLLRTVFAASVVAIAAVIGILFIVTRWSHF